MCHFTKMDYQKEIGQQRWWQGSKKKLEIVTVELKLDMGWRFDNGNSKTTLRWDLWLHKATVCTILKKSDEYKKVKLLQYHSV